MRKLNKFRLIIL